MFTVLVILLLLIVTAIASGAAEEPLSLDIAYVFPLSPTITNMSFDVRSARSVRTRCGLFVV